MAKQTLAEKMRDRINNRAGKEISRSVKNTEELVQVNAWVEMPDYFNRAAGGKGFPAGHITQIVGDSDTGKTTLVMEAMISAQQAGGVAFLIDSEHKFSFERFEMMGGRPEDIITISVESLEEAWDAWDVVCKEVADIRKEEPEAPIVAVWDSVAASVPDKILEEEDAGSAHVAVEAKINNKGVRKLRQAIRKSNLTAIFINHTYWTMPSFGISKEEVKGGREMYFMSTLILKTKRRSWLKRQFKGEDQRYGIQANLEVMKGHLGGRRTTTTFYIVPEGVLNDKKELDAYNKEIKGKE